MTRPPHKSWAPILLVSSGGALGTAAREGVFLAVPDLSEIPVAIALVNVVGAFLLGYLYEAVTRQAPTTPRGTSLKLLLGTGFCGGFTTYSSLATAIAILLTADRPMVAVLFALGMVVGGACATLAGLVTAVRHSRVVTR